MPPDNPPYCPSCPLFNKWNKVWGEGASDATIAFVGRNPGATENKLRRPFVGPAGKRLERVLDELGLSRASVWITNLVKCHTAHDAEPSKQTVACCGPCLYDEIHNHTLVVTLGKTASDAITAHYSGKAQVYHMIHPSAALRRGIYEAQLRVQTQELKGILQCPAGSGKMSKMSLFKDASFPTTCSP